MGGHRLADTLTAMTKPVGAMAVTDERTWERLLKDCQLPTLPGVAVGLLELCVRGDAGGREFADVIRVDPALSARLVKTANNAFFGLRFKVTTLQRAAIVLGTNHLKATLLGFKLAETIRAFGGATFDSAEFWRDSLLRGCLARRLAQRIRPQQAGEAFLVGLLQDIGILLLVRVIGEPYIRALRDCGGCQLRLFLREAEQFKVNHVLAAARLCQDWKLPKLLTVPILRHHTRPSASRARDTETILWQIAYFVGATPLAHQPIQEMIEPSLRGFARSAFGLTLSELGPILAGAASEFEGLGELFEDILPAGCEPTALMDQAAALFAGLADQLPQELLESL